MGKEKSLKINMACVDPVKHRFALVLHTNIASAFPNFSEVPAEDFATWIERPRQSEHGDYALPCFRLTKLLKMKPPEIAEKLKEICDGNPDPILTATEVIGPFVNFRLNSTEVAKVVFDKVKADQWLPPESSQASNQERVMIEFSQPNTHKEFHVGHTRNVALGNSLTKLFRYCGYKVTPANYYGDEGTHIAKCLWYIRKNNLRPEPGENKGEWLGNMYAKANNLLKDSSEEEQTVYNREVSEVLAAIEAQSGEIYQHWLETKKWSLDEFEKIYQWMHTEFDVIFSESQVSEESRAIVDEYMQKGIFIEDQGAIGVDLKPYKLGFSILRKKDGNTLYATKDLALARKKFQDYKIDRSVYVVGDEQIHHFKQVFKVLELMGFEQAKKCYHLSYGMVVLPSGKMSSRDGSSVTFSEFKNSIDEGLDAVLKKYEGSWSAQEIEETKTKLCEGVIKYGMLANDPNKKIVFDLEEWLSFEGNTGPYLMYSYTRTQSILEKSGLTSEDIDAYELECLNLSNESERELINQLSDFNNTVFGATENYKPSLLAGYLFDLCKTFNRFYADVSILKAEDEELKKSRLILLQLFSKTLKQGLGLLGIIPPDRM